MITMVSCNVIISLSITGITNRVFFRGGGGGIRPPLRIFRPPPCIFQKKSFIVQSVIDKQQHNSNRMVVEEGIRPGVLGPLGWAGGRLAGLLHSVEAHESG